MQMRFWRSRTSDREPVPAGQKPAAISAEFEAIRERFGQRLREDYAVLVRYRNCADPPAPELKAIVHRLAGTAAMVGFAEISAAATGLDDGFFEADANLNARLDNLLVVLERTVSNA
jgi:HPt (histidine-containing phosphotransfer) domain-containing protein